MNINTYQQLSDALFNEIEKQLDVLIDQDEIDLDYETIGNVISISFPNHSKIIINKQEPIHQIWLANKEQGYHFDYVDGEWRCSRTQEPFFTILNDSLKKQGY